MSRLTVTEKEHWKSRIENRINKSIEALQVKDVTLMQSVRTKAAIEAHKSLGTDKLHAKIEAISLQREALRLEQEQLEATMYRQALGPNSANQPTYSNRHEFNEMHRRAQLRTEEELLRKTSIGMEVMKLRDPKLFSQIKEELAELSEMPDVTVAYFDESTFSLNGVVPYGWQKTGERQVIDLSGARNSVHVLVIEDPGQVVSYIHKGSISGATVSEVLDDYAIRISQTTALVLDNASQHTYKLIQEKKAEWEEKDLILFPLPAYSP